MNLKPRDPRLENNPPRRSGGRARYHGRDAIRRPCRVHFVMEHFPGGSRHQLISGYPCGALGFAENRLNYMIGIKERREGHYLVGKKYVFGYAKHMRDSLPGGSFIGFTCTPIEKADANTQETFDGYVSIYDIEDAKEDKATVPIYYESRLAKPDINREEIGALNQHQGQVGGIGEANGCEGTGGGDRRGRACWKARR